MMNRKLSQAWEQWQWWYKVVTGPREPAYTGPRCCICREPIDALVPIESLMKKKSNANGVMYTEDTYAMRLCPSCAEKHSTTACKRHVRDKSPLRSKSPPRASKR